HRCGEPGAANALLREGDERILDIFERLKHRRMIGDEELVALRFRRLDRGGESPRVENGNSQRRTERPADRGAFGEVADPGAGGRDRAGEADARIAISLRLTDARGRLRIEPFRAPDV